MHNPESILTEIVAMLVLQTYVSFDGITTEE